MCLVQCVTYVSGRSNDLRFALSKFFGNFQEVRFNQNGKTLPCFCDKPCPNCDLWCPESPHTCTRVRRYFLREVYECIFWIFFAVAAGFCVSGILSST